MQTANRKNNNLSLALIAGMLMVVGLACNLSVLAETPTEIPPADAVPGTPQPAAISTAAPGSPDDCLAGIVPGATTKAQVIALLGDPVTAEMDGDAEYLFYASASKSHLNSITIQNQVVGLVSVLANQEPPLKWSEVKARYGEPAQTSYSYYSEGSRTYIYPDQGKAFIADETVDQVFLQECFAPMSLLNYMIFWGKYLPTDNPFTQ